MPLRVPGDEIGTMVGDRYKLIKCIGVGGFASVYRAMDNTTLKSYAIKRIVLKNVPKEELKNIHMEIELLSILKHDNIVKYVGHVTTKRYLNIIIELCDGGSLQQVAEEVGKGILDEVQVSKYMYQVLKGLDYLHYQGVVHRDIKGANILTTRMGKVKLADFGVATKVKGAQGGDEIAGTPYWMAPEIINGTGGLATSCDIWSVGCTVLELLTGKPPYFDLQPYAALYRIVQDEHPPLPTSITKPCKDFMIQCFQKDPSLRVDAKGLLKHRDEVKEEKAEPTPKVVEEKESEPSGPSGPAKCDLENYMDQEASGSEMEEWSEVEDEDEEEGESAGSDWDASAASAGSEEEEIDEDESDIDKLFDGAVAFEDEETRLRNERIAEMESQLENLRLTGEGSDFPALCKCARSISQLVETHFGDVETTISQMGAVPILEILETDHEELLVEILTLVDLLFERSRPCITSMCLLGLVPAINNLAQQSTPEKARILAAKLISRFCQHQKDEEQRKVFVSAGGMHAIVKLFSGQYGKNFRVMEYGVEAIGGLFTNPDRPIKDFCRLFTKAGILRPLVILLSSVVDDSEREGTDALAKRIADILLEFSKSKKKEFVVPTELARKRIVGVIISLLPKLENSEALIPLIKFIRTLAQHPITQQSLEDYGAIPTLVSYLDHPDVDVQNQTMMTLWAILQVPSVTTRQNSAVSSGIIPKLQRLYRKGLVSKNLAVWILCNFPKANSAYILREFKKYDGVRFYTELLYDTTSSSVKSSLSALEKWIRVDPHRVESVVSSEHVMATLRFLFTTSEYVTGFSQFIPHLARLLQSSGTGNHILKEFFSNEKIIVALNARLLESLQKRIADQPLIIQSLISLLSSIFCFYISDGFTEVGDPMKKKMADICSGTITKIENTVGQIIIKRQCATLLQNFVLLEM